MTATLTDWDGEGLPIGNSNFAVSQTDIFDGYFDTIRTYEGSKDRLLMVHVRADLSSGEYQLVWSPNFSTAAVNISFDPVYESSNSCGRGWKCYSSSGGTVTVDKSNGIKLVIKDVIMTYEDQVTRSTFILNGQMEWEEKPQPEREKV